MLVTPHHGLVNRETPCQDVGRDGDWNSAFGVGNPGASNEVKSYLKAFTSEQLQASVTPKQATPLFPAKLSLLSRHITKKMVEPGLSAASLFLYARDDAVFKCLFFSGDRANNLTLVKSQEILRLPNDNGFLFDQIWGKSLRDGSSNVFGIRCHTDASLCPIAAIERYFSIASMLGVDLSLGFLFRPLSPVGKVENKNISAGALQSRLRLYLDKAVVYEGETLHSFRAGVAITLALSGSQLMDIMEHVGWRQAPTAYHYMKVAQVLRPGGPSELLSHQSPEVQALTSSYTDLNNLIQFTAAFPRGSSS